MSTLTDSPAWHALSAHRAAMATVSLRELFADDAARFTEFSLSTGALMLDYSKNTLTRETLLLLFALAGQCGVERQRDAMFAGERINHTEDRAVLHVALRNRSARPVVVD